MQLSVATVLLAHFKIIFSNQLLPIMIIEINLYLLKERFIFYLAVHEQSITLN